VFQENCSHASTFFPLIKKQKSRINFLQSGRPSSWFWNKYIAARPSCPVLISYAKPTILQVNLQYLGNLSYSVCVCLTLFVPPFTVSDSPPPRSAEPSITYDSHTRTPPQNGVERANSACPLVAYLQQPTHTHPSAPPLLTSFIISLLLPYSRNPVFFSLVQPLPFAPPFAHSPVDANVPSPPAAATASRSHICLREPNTLARTYFLTIRNITWATTAAAILNTHRHHAQPRSAV